MKKQNPKGVLFDTFFKLNINYKHTNININIQIRQ